MGLGHAHTSPVSWRSGSSSPNDVGARSYTSSGNCRRRTRRRARPAAHRRPAAPRSGTAPPGGSGPAVRCAAPRCRGRAARAPARTDVGGGVEPGPGGGLPHLGTAGAASASRRAPARPTVRPTRGARPAPRRPAPRRSGRGPRGRRSTGRWPPVRHDRRRSRCRRPPAHGGRGRGRAPIRPAVAPVRSRTGRQGVPTLHGWRRTAKHRHARP